MMYDVMTQTLEPRPIGKVYGIVNMYRDGRNADNVDHLEQGLARLENDAARTIRNIHSAIEARQQEIRMKRRELEAIRKFTYLMHYRRTSLVSSYFDENDPDNKPIRDYLKNLRRKHNLHKKDDVWLFGLKYVLDTPHHKIIGTGETIQERYGGPTGMLEMLKTRVDPDIENFQAVDYTAMADANFLGIWEAAEDEEFVVGSNSFGLWEGAVDALSGLHRLFVVSPKIALVLRQNIVREPEMVNHIKTQAHTNSILIDIPMSVATSTYANYQRPPWRDSPGYLEEAARALSKYRLTPDAQEDVFTFQPTRLTREQTYAVNQIILIHLPNDGNVTFASPNAMRKTLEHHLQSNRIPYAGESKYLLRNLLGLLSESVVPKGPNPSTSSALLPRSGVDIVLPMEPLSSIQTMTGLTGLTILLPTT
ncbi:unnamed protein product [Cyclocybe aegerita]|uniref:Uncharacterized protein n=1 Tax=Cyclocybe aegerita TaxID=1973307 RepID=A0A8S0VS89_CYCAE|nr:unnamed protein product [Cyclocybe aegerita]